MSASWIHRKTRLQELLKSHGDEDEDALALDRLLHGQLVIGKTIRTTEIDSVRFQDRDLQVLGTLEYGQFGVIDVVTCRLDSRVYIRKSTEKKFALRTREQCSPQFERDILLKALQTNTCWAPHLLCAFHTPTHLNLVMDYAEGGTLWDVLESSPLQGRISEDDLRWWAPQIVSAINWCHSQGFVHRDIKPHNFVITPTAHVLLIDFGSAAPLQPPARDGSRQVPKQYCLVPCGTCDYISPEILKAHEQALLALEIEDSEDPVLTNEDEVYGLETDWWSLGAMLYEMAYGVAPFFADDIRRTYFRIMDHRKSLKFNLNVSFTIEYQDFLKRLLTDAEFRLGRHNFAEITTHPFFNGVDWNAIPQQTKPSSLHLPQFSYSTNPELKAANTTERASEEFSQPFAFSALFQSSAATSSPGLSILRESPAHKSNLTESTSAAAFIGFSWGPPKDAFPEVHMEENTQHELPNSTGLGLSPALNTPRPLRIPSTWLTPTPTPQLPGSHLTPTPSLPGSAHTHAFSTPIRPTELPATPYHAQTLPRVMGSTIRRTNTGTRRAVSDREAMKQLADCVGMSARKRVMESGRKPRVLNSYSFGIGTGSTARKELRFGFSAPNSDGPIRFEYPQPSLQQFQVPNLSGHTSGSGIGRFFGAGAGSDSGIDIDTEDGDSSVDTGTDTDTGSEAPPSPSPSPRPGSAMSMMSGMMSISKRSGTPTLTSTFSQRLGTPSMTSRSYGSGRNRSLSGGSLRRLGAPGERSVGTGTGARADPSARVTSLLSFEHETLDELEVKHATIMEDILSLERRLGRFQQQQQFVAGQ